MTVIFRRAIPVVDEDTLAPVSGVTARSWDLVELNAKDALVALSFESDRALRDAQSDLTPDDLKGGLYRYSSPSALHPGGSVKKLLNAQGKGALLGVEFEISRGLPSATDIYVADGKATFLIGGDRCAYLMQADRDGWRECSHILVLMEEGVVTEDTDPYTVSAHSMLPSITIPVPGHGIFWAPSYKPEVIQTDGDDGQQWKRTPLDTSIPKPDHSPIQNSANGWVYYNTHYIVNKTFLSFIFNGLFSC